MLLLILVSFFIGYDGVNYGYEDISLSTEGRNAGEQSKRRPISEMTSGSTLEIKEEYEEYNQGDTEEETVYNEEGISNGNYYEEET